MNAIYNILGNVFQLFANVLFLINVGLRKSSHYDGLLTDIDYIIEPLWSIS